MKMKINNISGKTFTKNQRLFSELCILRNERFLSPLMKIRKSLGLKKIKQIYIAALVLGDKPTRREWDMLLKFIHQMNIDRIKIFKTLDKVKIQEFYEQIDNITINNNLGSEWRGPLILFVTHGMFVPPFYNLDIQSDPSQRTLNICMNSTTTLNDIKTAWSLINEEKIKVFGNISRRNLSNKSVENLITLAKIKIIEKKLPKMKGTGILAEINPKMDKVAFDAESDKRATDNIRQIKSRFNRKV